MSVLFFFNFDVKLFKMNYDEKNYISYHSINFCTKYQMRKTICGLMNLQIQV